MSDTIMFTLDGQSVEVPAGKTVLEAARIAGIQIPTLCYLKGVSRLSACRMCLVEAGNKLLSSCTLQATPGMNIKTHSKRVLDARRVVAELLLSNHREECTTCARSDNCELQTVAHDLGLSNHRFTGRRTQAVIDNLSPSIVRDAEKCILCGRCVAVCQDIQTVDAIGFSRRGFETVVGPVYSRSLAESVCVNCGQCIVHCPVGALTEKDSRQEVWDALFDPAKFVVAQTAPAVRVALGEAFGMPVGSRVTGKMVNALRMLGFDRVFDTDFGADLTIMEEATELIHRLQTGQNLPLMTSCCPGWVKFIEQNFPELLDNLSTCQSPHEMEGALIKTYLARKLGVPAENIVVVSIMPCVGKKFEQQREELAVDGLQNIDYVLTTRELARMIKELGIDFVHLQDAAFDNPFGQSSGAGAIFGATGGVAEAALRTVFEFVAGEELETVEYTAVRGLAGIKEATVILPDGTSIRTAIVHGLGNARRVMEMVERGERSYEFIEVMACPGGCIAGGGQPIVSSRERETIDVKQLRSRAIYDEDEAMTIRKSHRNPFIAQVYREFLGEPGSPLAHRLLHTHYHPRSRF